MKEMYLPTMIQTGKRMAKIAMPEQFVHFESYRNFLKHLISILVISEIEIPLDLENLDIFEMVIKVFLNICPLSSFIPSQQQGQQKLHPQTQMQPTSVSSLQHGSMPSLSTHLGTPAVQPNIINEMQSDSALETVQGNALSSLEQSQNSTSNPISPSTPLAPSPIPGNPEQHISRVSKHSIAGNIGQTEGAIPLSTIISAKPSETEQAEQPIVVKSVSAKSLAITAVDRLEGSTPDNGSRAAVDGDLEDTEKCHFKLNEIHVDAVSSDDSMNNRFKRSAGPEITELESSTESLSRIKKPRV